MSRDFHQDSRVSNTRIHITLLFSAPFVCFIPSASFIQAHTHTNTWGCQIISRNNQPPTDLYVLPNQVKEQLLSITTWPWLPAPLHTLSHIYTLGGFTCPYLHSFHKHMFTAAAGDKTECHILWGDRMKQQNQETGTEDQRAPHCYGGRRKSRLWHEPWDMV